MHRCVHRLRSVKPRMKIHPPIFGHMKKCALILVLFSVCLLPSLAQTGLFMKTQFWGSQLEISWLFFTSDKKVVRNPKFGVNPVQIPKEISENGRNVASYSLSGNRMNLRWGDGRVQNVNVEFKNGVLSAFDGGLCSKPNPFPFRYFNDKTYSGLAVVGNVTRTVTLFLGRDGRFRSDRIGAVSGTGNLTGVAAVEGSESGTYSINGNTIVFKYTNGAEWRAVAQPYDLGREEIIVNDQLFKRD